MPPEELGEERNVIPLHVFTLTPALSLDGEGVLRLVLSNQGGNKTSGDCMNFTLTPPSPSREREVLRLVLSNRGSAVIVARH